MEKQPDNFGIALANAEMGVVSIPCRYGTKVPMAPWKRWQSEMPPTELLRRWFKNTRTNIAIITSGMVVFDCDDADEAELIFIKCGPTPHILRTPRGGVHLGYRKRKGVEVHNQVRIKGEPIDIRTDGGIEVIPSSCTEHGEYRWLGEGLKPIAELPVANIGWTRERTKRVLHPIGPIDEADAMARRARAYASHVEGAVNGQGGHRKTFRLACKLTHLPPVGFGLGFDQALAILGEWSESSCDPPWSMRELEHKVADAIKRR